MGQVTSWGYIKDSFDPTDRLAVVIRRQRNGELVQRIATAEQIAAPRFQAWLRFENVHGGNVYLSMNPLKPDARGRTKQDIAWVRHLYLDLDYNGTQALAAILGDSRLPKPSYVLDTSPGKHQVTWKVEGFTAEQAERMQRAMAIAFGADRAAPMRPGFSGFRGCITENTIRPAGSQPRNCLRRSTILRISGSNQ
jgi:hypothetical protein